MARTNFKKTKYTGIYVKEDPKTKIKTYLARFKVKGIEFEKIVGYSNDKYKTKPSLAFQRRIELINKMKNGESIKLKDNPILEDFFKTYKEYKKHTVSENKLKIYTYFFNKHVSQKLKTKKIKDVTKEDLQKIINTLIENNYKPTTIETMNHIFSPLFNYGIEIGIVDKNVAKGLKFPKFDRNRYFSLDEDKAKALYQEILNIPDNQYRTMFLFLLRGRRAGEVLSLDWKYIDLRNKKYTIIDSQSKIRKTLTFVLDEELIEALRCLNEQKEGLVFISPVTGKQFYSFPKRLWKKLKENCAIENMKLHDFRHLLGYTLVNKGVPLEYISKALGHSKISTTQIYSNQKEQMASEAVDTYLDLMK